MLLKDRRASDVVGRERIAQALVSTGVFATPALSLALPSGYSLGILCLLLAGLLGLPDYISRSRTTIPAAVLHFLLAAWWMVCVWFFRIDNVGWNHVEGYERLLKYALSPLAAVALLTFRPPPQLAWYGCTVGAILAGATAITQVHILGYERANGHTNAIQFGNLALLLSLWSAVGLHYFRGHTFRTLWGFLGMIGGSAAIFLSGTRSAWWITALAVLVYLWATLRPRHADAGPRGTGTYRALGPIFIVLVSGAITVLMWQPITNRISEGLRDLQLYHDNNTDTSLGHRLAHWKLAWRLGYEQPLLGWGQQGYEKRKAELVSTNEAPSIVLRFRHAHSDVLDLWAKAGLVGVVSYCLLLGTPLWYSLRLWRAQRTHCTDPDALVIRYAALCGTVTVLCYVGFGLTQTFFAHNNGNMMYLYMTILWLCLVFGVRPQNNQTRLVKHA